MDSVLVLGEVIDDVVTAGSLAWFIFLKNGFLVSEPNDDEAGAGAEGGGSVGAEGGDCIGAEDGLVGGSDAAGVDMPGGERSDGCVLPSLERT